MFSSKIMFCQIFEYLRKKSIFASVFFSLKSSKKNMNILKCNFFSISEVSMVNTGQIQQKEFDCDDPGLLSVLEPHLLQPFSCPPLPHGATLLLLQFTNVQRTEHYVSRYVRLQLNQKQRQDIILLLTNLFCDDKNIS